MSFRFPNRMPFPSIVAASELPSRVHGSPLVRFHKWNVNLVPALRRSPLMNSVALLHPIK